MNDRVVRGRYAPSPTGRLHVGNARTALATWLSARTAGGTFVMRIEDLDTPRSVAGMEKAILDDLRWLGLDWDEGPDVSGPYAPYRQSERLHRYGDALERLLEAKRIFPCRVSRKDLQNVASAPHGDGPPPYPPSLRPQNLALDWFGEVVRRRDAAIRFLVHDQPISFDDAVAGPVTEKVSETVGDFVLRRRDDVYAYQLAVVVDDLAMGITEVVRGRDLLSSTARQIQLIEALGGTPPGYAHVPLVLNAAGEKLSKRDAGLTLEAIRGAGVRPDVLVGYLAWSLGLQDAPTPATPASLVPGFAWRRVRKDDFILPDDFPDRLFAEG